MAWPARRVFRVVRPAAGRAPGCCSWGAARSPLLPSQIWWILSSATLCALPLTIWEFRKQGYDTHYMGEPTGTCRDAQLPAPAPPGLTVRFCTVPAAWFIGGIFVIITVPISIYEVGALACRGQGGVWRCAAISNPATQAQAHVSTTASASTRTRAAQVAMHTEYYTRPKLQRHVIRILWMVRFRAAGLAGWAAAWQAACQNPLATELQNWSARWGGPTRHLACDLAPTERAYGTQARVQLPP
jgi:hypothetical protein